MSEEMVTVDELAEKAESHLRESSLTPEEYEALAQRRGALTAFHDR